MTTPNRTTQPHSGYTEPEVSPGKGISWRGIIAGVLTALFVYLVMTVVGIALGLAAFDARNFTFDGMPIGTILWQALSFAVAAFAGGYTGSAAAGYTTVSRGRFNGFVVGMLFPLVFSLFAFNLITSGIGALFNATSAIVDTAATGVGAVTQAVGTAVGEAAPSDFDALLDNLGLRNEFDALVGGFSDDDLATLIADTDESLSEEQVNAAVSVIRNEFQRAGRNIRDSLGDVTTLDDVAVRQADNLQEQLSGTEFIANLEAQGLTTAQAIEVANVINQRVDELRTEVQETTQAIRARSEQVLADAERIAIETANTAARRISQAAWIWLLLTGVSLALATLGGSMGDTLEKNRVKARETQRPVKS